MKVNKKNVKKRIVIILIILIIALLLLILTMNRVRTPQETFKYIYSDEMDEGTFSPEMIHMVIAAYEGEVNPKAISKATYYMITSRIPEYLNNCKDDTSTEKYFEKNSDSIYLATGIKDKENFKNLMTELRKVSERNLKFEYAKFDRDTIKVNKNNLEVVLKIKYQGQEEISLDVKIKNKDSSRIPSIEFSK